MINKSSNESTLEKIYKNLESGMPENKSIKEYALPIGYTAKIKIVKNKVAPPFKKLEIPVMFNRGYDLETDLIEAGMMFGLITRAGAFYTLGETKVQGRDKLRIYLLENEVIRKELEQKIQKEVSDIRIGKIDVPDEIDVVKEKKSEGKKDKTSEKE